MAHDVDEPVRTCLAEQGGSLYRRVLGQAVYLTPKEHGTPHVLLHNLRHNRALHHRVVNLHGPLSA